jgi:hypothetical protein
VAEEIAQASFTRPIRIPGSPLPGILSFMLEDSWNLSLGLPVVILNRNVGTYLLQNPMSSIRERLLDAAARVYAETGYRGATTRRIAQEAGVNEITLFRHFGSKTTLIFEAVRQVTLRTDCATLPATPGDPASELREWVREELEHLTKMRSILRTSLG